MTTVISIKKRIRYDICHVFINILSLFICSLKYSGMYRDIYLCWQIAQFDKDDSDDKKIVKFGFIIWKSKQ